MGERRARRQHQRGEIRPRHRAQIRGDETGAAPPSATLSALSSQAITSAPPAFSAWQLASPEPPRPNTATFLPAKAVTGIMIVIHRSFSVARPASASITEMIQNRITICGSVQPSLLEMMMDRRHPEDALAGELERGHLHDHRHRLQHEQAADDGQHDLVLDRDRDGAEHAAERQRAGVAHEDRGRRRVEPEEAQARADHRAAEHRQLAGAGDVVDLQIVGEHDVAGEIGDQAEGRRRDHHRHDGEAVEPVGEVDRIAGADDDEGAEDHEEPAEIDHQFLEERKRQRGRRRRRGRAATSA